MRELRSDMQSPPTFALKCHAGIDSAEAMQRASSDQGTAHVTRASNVNWITCGRANPDDGRCGPRRIRPGMMPFARLTTDEDEDDAVWTMLLRNGRNRSVRRARSDGLLPLPLLPVMVRRTGQRFQPLEAGSCQNHVRDYTSLDVPEDAAEPAAILRQMRRPSHDHASAARTDRRVRGDAAGAGISAGGARQLRGDRIAGARWLAEIEGFSARIRRFRRDDDRIAGRKLEAPRHGSHPGPHNG